MNRVEIVMTQPVTSVRRSSLPIAHHYQGASGSSCSGSSYGECSIEKEPEKMKQFSEATIKEIVKYRRYLFVILLCLVYAIVGVILIVFKSGQPAIMPQITTDEDLQINQQIATNSTSLSNGSLTDSHDHGTNNQWLEEPEVINRWHMHNTSQSLKHKHTSEGTNLKDCGTNAEGQHYKYGNLGCLFRRATDSDLSGDLCCCSGPVRLRIHHNHTTATPSPAKSINQTIVNGKLNITNQNNTIDNIKINHTSNDKQHSKNLMIPNIICFGTPSSKLFNVQKVVPPIAKNSKVTFTVMKSGTDYPASFVNRLLTRESEPPKRRSDQEQPKVKGFWISVRQGLVRSMKRLHDFVFMLYDVLELAVHNAKHGHVVPISPAETQSIDDREHEQGLIGLNLMELPSILNRLQPQLATKDSLVAPGTDVSSSTNKMHSSDYDTYVDIDEPNISLLFKNRLSPTSSTTSTSTSTTSSTTTQKPSSLAGNSNHKESSSERAITIKTAPSSPSDTVSLLNITSSSGDGSKSTKVTIITEKLQPHTSSTSKPSLSIKTTTTTTTTTRGPNNQTISMAPSGRQNETVASTTITSQTPTKLPSSSKSPFIKPPSSSTASPDSLAKKSIIISLGDGKSKTIITTIETDENNNEAADQPASTTTTTGSPTSSFRPTKNDLHSTISNSTTTTTAGPAILESSATTRGLIVGNSFTPIPKANGAHFNEKDPSSQRDKPGHSSDAVTNGATMQISNLNSTLGQLHPTDINANTSEQREPKELIGLVSLKTKSPSPGSTSETNNNPSPPIADTNSLKPLKKLIMPTGPNDTMIMATIANNNLINLSNEAVAVDSGVIQSNHMAIASSISDQQTQSNQANDDVTAKDRVNLAFSASQLLSPVSGVYSITNNQPLVHSYLKNDYANANSNATVNIDANKNQIDTIQVVELDSANATPASYPVQLMNQESDSVQLVNQESYPVQLENPASYQSSGHISNTTVKLTKTDTENTPGIVTLMEVTSPESIGGPNKFASETKSSDHRTPPTTSQYQESVASVLGKPEEFPIVEFAAPLIEASGQSNSTTATTAAATTTSAPQLLVTNKINSTINNSTAGNTATTRPPIKLSTITTRVPLPATTKLFSTKRSQSIVITLPNDHKRINITTTS